MSVLSTLAAQFTQHKLTKHSLVGKRETAKKAERARVDRIHSGRVVTKKKSKPLTSGQKATSRRKSIMKGVAPHQSLMKALTQKKK